MIPLAWLASPLGKLGAGLGAAALLAGMYWGFVAYQRSVGREQEAEEQRVDQMEQQQESLGLAIRQASIQSYHADKFAREKQQIDAQLSTITAKRTRHAKQNDALLPVDPGTRDIVHDLTSMLPAQSDAQRVPSSSETIVQSAGPVNGPATSDDLLEIIHELTKRTAVAEAGWRNLSEENVAQYYEAVKFCLEQFQDGDEGHRYCIGHAAPQPEGTP